MCWTAVPHSASENDPVSEVIKSPSPVGKTDGNSGSAISNFDRYTVPNSNSGAVCLSRPIPDAKPFYARRDVLSRKNTLNKSMKNENTENKKITMDHMKSQCKVFTGSMYGWDRKGGGMVPNWHEQKLIDYMRDLSCRVGFSGYQIANCLEDIGETGKLGGKWRSTTVIRTMNYEFHQQREKFPKPDWWMNEDFHDTRPLKTTEFLDLYPEPIVDGVSQVESKSKDTANTNAEEGENQSHTEWLKKSRYKIINWNY